MVNELPIVEISWASHIFVKDGLRKTANGEIFIVAVAVAISEVS